MDEKIVGLHLAPEQAMRLAISEAKKGAAFTSPNPQVGCVILDRDSKFLASAYHEKFGGPHAEINALAKVSEAQLKGAQVYVTLEPCAHEGKTPSCAKKLVTLPLAKVVYGLKDPNPLVSGQGAQILKDKGIPCQLYREFANSNLEVELEESCEAFLWNYRHKKIFVALKSAISLDGRIALADGTSQWITGPEARLKGHELRAEMDALLIGAGTLEKDDPSLNVRLPAVQKTNRVVVLDTKGTRLKNSWKIFSAHTPENIFWITGDQSDVGKNQYGVNVLKVPLGKNGGLDLSATFGALYSVGLRSVLVEGGGAVTGSVLRENLANRLHLFQAPVLLGDDAMAWDRGFHVGLMAQKPYVKNARTISVGPDQYLTGLLREPTSGDQCCDT